MADKEDLVKDIVFINGISRAGKFLMGTIVCGFEKMEYFQYVSTLEHLAYMEKLGFTKKDGAISILRVIVDEHAYNMGIGRNLNLRADDISGIHNSFEKDKFIKRSLNPINNELVGFFRRGEYIPAFILHECLPNIDIFLKAFPAMKWVNVIRHPVDVIHSWYVRGWGHRSVSDPLSFIPMVTEKDGDIPVPWYAYGWRREYRAMLEMDRIIRSVHCLTSLGSKSYDAIPDEARKKVIITRFEDILSKPEDEIRRIGVFLKNRSSDFMGEILKKQKCPRIIDPIEREKKYDAIAAEATKPSIGLLDELVCDYESMKETGGGI